MFAIGFDKKEELFFKIVVPFVFIKNNYDELKVRLPKGRKADVEQFAQSKGQSVNGLVNELLVTEMGYSSDEWKEGKRDAD